MNDRFRRTTRRFANHAGLLITGWFLAGCGPQKEPPAPEATAEVRGEAIRGEPIVQTSVPAPGPDGETLDSPSSVPEAAEEAAAADAAAEAEVPVATANEAERAKASPGGSPGNSEPAVASSAAPLAPGLATAEKTEAAPAGGDKPAGTAANPLSVEFEKLASFAYALPEGPVETNEVKEVAAASQIPEAIRSLNDQFISLKGFMLPLKVEKGLVTELLIMRDQSMCCYGTVPKINEWVSVKMVGEGVKPVMDQAVTLFGKLKVGEMYENGYLVGIYALDGERMAGPLDL